jgi:uncharacterized membrane protein
VVVWLGGMFLLVMVMLLTAKKAMQSGAPEAFGILSDAAKKFLPIAWAAMILLGVSGAYFATDHWGIRPNISFTDYGRFMQILRVKTFLFLFVVSLSLLHDFWLGPKIIERMEQARQSGEVLPQSLARKLARMTAGINLLSAVTILVLAVYLFRP